MKSKDKEFNKKLLSLVIPIAFQQFMLNLISASDAVMLGAISQNQLSAVSLAGQVQFVLGLFLAAITIGTGIFAAQYWGKKDIPAVENFFGIAIRITIPVAAVFTVCTAVLPEIIMRIFTSNEELVLYGARYLRAASPSYLFCGISQIYMCIMKNSEHASRSTLISSVCAVFDAVLNAILIFGLLGFEKMEIEGAAISTSIARLVELCWILITFGKNQKIKLRMKLILLPHTQFRRDFWKYTLPVLGNELVWGIGFTMYSVIMGHLGTDAVAANSITNIAKNLVICFCIGLGSGGGIIIGNELGAGRLDKAREYGSRLCRLSIVSGLLSGLLLLCISPLILLFTDISAQAGYYLIRMLIICSFYMVGKSVNMMTIAGIFCAGGDSKFGFICDTVVMWGITVPLGLIAAFILKLPILIVYLIINADEIFKLPAVYRHYKKYIWLKDLTVTYHPNKEEY